MVESRLLLRNFTAVNFKKDRKKKVVVGILLSEPRKGDWRRKGKGDTGTDGRFLSVFEGSFFWQTLRPYIQDGHLQAPTINKAFDHWFPVLIPNHFDRIDLGELSSHKILLVGDSSVGFHSLHPFKQIPLILCQHRFVSSSLVLRIFTSWPSTKGCASSLSRTSICLVSSRLGGIVGKDDLWTLVLLWKILTFTKRVWRNLFLRWKETYPQFPFCKLRGHWNLFGFTIGISTTAKFPVIALSKLSEGNKKDCLADNSLVTVCIENGIVYCGLDTAQFPIVASKKIKNIWKTWDTRFCLTFTFTASRATLL